MLSDGGLRCDVVTSLIWPVPTISCGPLPTERARVVSISLNGLLVNLRHPDTGGLSEASFDQGLSVFDHVHPFCAFDGKNVLSAFQCIGDEIM